MSKDGPAASAAGERPLTPHEETVRGLSERLVAAQRPLRILDAVGWDASIEQTFFAHGGRELPPVTPDYYQRRPLGFNPAAKLRELAALERDIARLLGKVDPAGRIMARMCREYRQAVLLLSRRGTPAFADISARLYGRAADRLDPDGRSLFDLSRNLPPAAHPDEPGETTLDSRQAREVLMARFREYFRDGVRVRVRLADGMAADAAAGRDYLKLRRDARFTLRELRLLEVHEGWVHLGTTLNGQSQAVCTFLSKSSPGATPTQEGLAVLTELAAAASHPGRVRRLALRVAGIARAEAGADFLEVYRSFLAEGVESRESYQLTMRVFRGSLPRGCGPFTKDLCYSRGLVQVARFLKQALTVHSSGLASLLFCGKTALEDVPALAELRETGLLRPPRYVPPPFADADGLAQRLDHFPLAAKTAQA